MQLKIESLLREKKQDVKAFLVALGNGRGKTRVLEDMATGKRIRVTSTPTKIVNGDIIVGSIADSALEKYLTK